MNSPYAVAATDYLEAGWSPIALPLGQKSPVPDDYTGAHGKWVDAATVAEWISGRVRAGQMIYPAGNVALRLPPDVIGIDVDMYEGKQGRETLSKAEESWGELPQTWFSSSRSDGSGIRLYRIPPGLAWPGKLPQGGGVEIIRFDHRYCIVAPSVHPNGEQYQWWEEVSNTAVRYVVCAGFFPAPEDLPELPQSWIEGLTSGRKWVDRPAAEMDIEDVRLWLSDRNGPDLCRTMERTLTKYLRAIREAGDDGGAHDEARNGAWACIGDAATGHSGIDTALRRLRQTFLIAVDGRRELGAAKKEWIRSVVRGVQKVAAEGIPKSADSCADAATATLPTEEDIGSGFEFERSDVGNAKRLVHMYRHNFRYVEALGGWFFWSDADGIWRPDLDGEITRCAISVADRIDREAAKLDEENAEAATELRKFARASANAGKIKAMVDLAKDMQGITLDPTVLDAAPEVFGEVSLGTNPGVELRPPIREDYRTMRTAVPYRADAESKLWSRFLDRIQPNPDIQDWLQRLVGYSLYGRNFARLLVVCFGPTSTGKTTFASAIAGALGDYAEYTDLTVLHGNQAERPRADIIRVLSKRFVYAEEASAAWELHPDQIKRLAGGGMVAARAPFAKTFIRREPAFTMWLMSNSPPTIRGADSALWRRIRVVPFTNQVPSGKEDLALIDRLSTPRARAAILAWAVEGWGLYAALRAAGEDPLAVPADVPELFTATQEFRSGVSDLDSFASDVLDFGEDFTESANVLYAAYQQWCTVNGVKTESSTALGRFLTGNGIGREKRRVDGKPVMVRLGVRVVDSYRSVLG